jgi:hypothetical protein
MSALPLPTLCHCVRPSCLSSPSCRLLAVSRELPLPQKNFSATPTHLFEPKSFICNAYKKHGGVGECTAFARHSPLATSATRRNARNSNPLLHLLHNSRRPRVGGDASSEVKLLPFPSRTCPTALCAQILPSPFNFQLSTLSTSHQSPATSYRTRITPP